MLNRLRTRKTMLSLLLCLVMLAVALPAGLMASATPAVHGPEDHTGDCLKLGDATLDQELDIDDILAVRGHMFGTQELTGRAFIAVDLFNNGEIDIDVILGIRSEMFGLRELGWICDGVPTDPPPTEEPSPTAPATGTPSPDVTTASSPSPTLSPANAPMDVWGVVMQAHQDHPSRGAWSAKPDKSFIFYAVQGEGYVDDTFAAILDEHFPEGVNLTTEAAQAVLAACKEKLRFAIVGSKLTYGGNEYSTAGNNFDMDARPIRLRGTVDFDTMEMTVTSVLQYSGNSMPSNFSQLPERLQRADIPKAGLEANAGKPDLSLKIGAASAKMKYIPAGDFLQGSWFFRGWRYQDEYPHKVTFNKSWYMMEIPVTQGMWNEYVGSDPLLTAPGELILWNWDKTISRVGMPSPSIGDDKFMTNLNVDQIKKFIEKVKADNPDLTGNGVDIRLCTDAEWEYALRMGDSNIDSQEKYKPMQSTMRKLNAGENAVTSTVGMTKTKPANGWGLYDMQIDNAYHWSSYPKADNVRTAQIDPAPNMNASLFKAKGGTHYTCWSPSMHGAIVSDGDNHEGTFSVIRLIVTNADEAITIRGMS